MSSEEFSRTPHPLQLLDYALFSGAANKFDKAQAGLKILRPACRVLLISIAQRITN